MSDCYGICCIECGQNSQTGIAPAEIIFAALRCWPHVKALINEPWIDVNLVGDRDTPHVFDFLKEHYEHGLMLLDEYGHINKLPRRCEVCGKISVRTWCDGHGMLVRDRCETHLNK